MPRPAPDGRDQNQTRSYRLRTNPQRRRSPSIGDGMDGERVGPVQRGQQAVAGNSNPGDERSPDPPEGRPPSGSTAVARWARGKPIGSRGALIECSSPTRWSRRVRGPTASSSSAAGPRKASTVGVHRESDWRQDGGPCAIVFVREVAPRRGPAFQRPHGLLQS